MKRSSRAKVMDALIDRYGFEIIQGWASLHCVQLREDDDESEWWLDDNDHRFIMAINDVRDGQGDWTGIKQETEKWVFANADEMHTILWDLAEGVDCSVWEYLETYGGLGDVCSWVLESILKQDNQVHNLPRFIGFIVGNEITAEYQSLAYEINGEHEDE